MIATKLCFATQFGLNTWITGQRELGGRTDPLWKHHNGRLGNKRLSSLLDKSAASTYDWELAGACGLIDGSDTMLLLLAGQRFSYRGATANQRMPADWLTETKQFFLGMINGGNTMLFLACAGGLINRPSHDASSLGWLTVWLVKCNGKLACKGGLINGNKTMLFLGMIDGGNTTLLLPVAGGMIDGRDTVLLLSAGQQFGCLCAMVNQHAQADWLTAATRCFFLVWSTAATQRYF